MTYFVEPTNIGDGVKFIAYFAEPSTTSDGV